MKHPELDEYYFETWLGKANETYPTGGQDLYKEKGCSEAFNLYDCARSVCGNASFAEDRISADMKQLLSSVSKQYAALSPDDYESQYATLLSKSITAQNEDMGIGHKPHGDWTIDKVGPPEKGDYYGRTTQSMCQLTSTNRRVVRDTIDEEKYIFHKAAKLIDRDKDISTAIIDVFWHMSAMPRLSDVSQDISLLSNCFLNICAMVLKKYMYNMFQIFKMFCVDENKNRL